MIETKMVFGEKKGKIMLTLITTFFPRGNRPERGDAAGEPAAALRGWPHLHLRREHPDSGQPVQVPSHLQPEVCAAVPEPADRAHPAAAHFCHRRQRLLQHAEGETESGEFFLPTSHM